MSSKITKIDRIYSNQGAEWHGQAIYKRGDGSRIDGITREDISGILFPVREIGNLSGVDSTSGETISFPEQKGIFGDLRQRGEGLIPLSIQGEGYRIIENSAIFEAVENGLKGVPHKVTTAGTLDGAKRFFLSIQLTDAPSFMVNGEEWKSFVNFISSHDGTLALAAYDSSTRIVCQNTLRASLRKGNRGKHRLSIVHKKGAEMAVSGMERWLESMLGNRADFAASLEKLLDVQINPDRLEKILTGYTWQETGTPDELSTRALNSMAGIIDRVYNGPGNVVASGRSIPTAFDLLNGFTDHYSNGPGAGGKDTPQIQSRVNGSFGSAADRKEEFAGYLMGDTMEWLQSMETAADRYKSGLERNRSKGVADLEPAPQARALSMMAGI